MALLTLPTLAGSQSEITHNGHPAILRETNSGPKRMVAMRIELNCAACGNNHFSLDREMDDDAHVRCRDCGH
jgi:DNA-directed RNA polymerase subunit RPC12/RpoP